MTVSIEHQSDLADGYERGSVVVPMQKFRALIFDCDGVLVNSEEIAPDLEPE